MQRCCPCKTIQEKSNISPNDSYNFKREEFGFGTKIFDIVPSILYFFFWDVLIYSESTIIERPLRLDKRIASFSECQCYTYFETRKEDLPRLLQGLRIPLVCKFDNGSVMVGEEVMLRGLYELVTSESQYSIAENVLNDGRK